MARRRRGRDAVHSGTQALCRHPVAGAPACGGTPNPARNWVVPTLRFSIGTVVDGHPENDAALSDGPAIQPENDGLQR